MNYYEKFVINKKDIEHLKKKDDKLKKLIEIIGDIDREYIPNPFIAIINNIIFQQLSYKAAITIWNRFEDLVKEISPKNILSFSFEELRGCGISSTKINYIKNIAHAFINKDIDLDNINNITDEDLMHTLTKIKGVGTWTVEMFLMFSLKRMDILSYKDLGIRKGLIWLYSIKNELTIQEFEKIKNKFSPYNTILSFYLWEITIKDLFRFKNIDEAYNNQNHNVGYIDSKLGVVEIKSENNQIISLEFVNKIRKEKLDETIINAKKQIQEYFNGARRDFDLPIKINGTEFQVKVWNELINIPFGSTLSYGDVAKNIGNGKASRAIGNANNKNKIALIIPCHRVIGKNGKLVGYEGGLWRKEWLLNHEKRYS